MALGEFTLGLVIFAVAGQIVVPCPVTITNFEEVREQFDEYRTEHAARLINFKISGIEWSDSSNETYEIFDPNWLSWVKENSETVSQLPLDYSILSFGLSRFAIMDINFVNFTSDCVQGLPFVHQRKLVMEKMLELMHEEPGLTISAAGKVCSKEKRNGDNDLVCQSVYSRRSWVTGLNVGVGKSCCKKGWLRSCRDNMYVQCYRMKITGIGRDQAGFAAKSMAISLIGFLLPFIIIACAIAWYQYNPMNWGDEFRNNFSDYRLGVVFPLAYFITRNARSTEDTAPMSLNEMTLVIDEHELEPYEGAVSLFDLLRLKTHRVADFKIKLTLLYLLQFVPVTSWLVYYSYKSDTLLRLNSAEKILFSLRNNPYSWLWTDSSLWPHQFSVFLIFLTFVPVPPLIVWWLLEFRTIRHRLIKCAHPTKQAMKIMFKIFFCILVICSYISIYSLCNSIIYVIGSLIISIDTVSPWLTGGILALYYVHRSYGELVETYTEIKRIMFELCIKEHTFKANHAETIDSFRGTDNSIINLRTRFKKVHTKKEEFEGPVWFVKQIKSPEGTSKVENQGLSKKMMSKETLVGLCEWIQPIKSGIRKAAVKLAFTLLFLAIVVFTINVFHPNAATKEASVLITSMGTLLAALIPRLAEMMGTGAESRIEASILKLNIKEWFSSDGAKSTFDVIDDRRRPSKTAQLEVSEMQSKVPMRTKEGDKGVGRVRTQSGAPSLTGDWSYTNIGYSRVERATSV